MSIVSTVGLGTGIIRRTVGALAALTVTAGIAVGAPAVNAAPGPTMPVEFDLSRYQPVDPTTFRSLAYGDNGRSFFTTGRWMCQIGQAYRYVGCQGRPATAPPTATGAAISGDQQGPWWVNREQTYRFGSKTGFRPPLLGVGKRVTIAGVTCTVPRRDVVACRTGERALIFTPRGTNSSSRPGTRSDRATTPSHTARTRHRDTSRPASSTGISCPPTRLRRSRGPRAVAG